MRDSTRRRIHPYITVKFGVFIFGDNRSALADANESRDWRICAEFAHALIRTARRLYAKDSLAVDFAETVYALDASTTDLCLSLRPWAKVSYHQGGGETAHAARFARSESRSAIGCLLLTAGLNVHAFIHGSAKSYYTLHPIRTGNRSLYQEDFSFLLCSSCG
jgi:hypothetical protein